ncbi:MAG: manganese efflux pump MntP family protein [Eubacteriales bacterium]|nr:manganese efflux pump MntP family protein [Eubacteriales bacterium]
MSLFELFVLAVGLSMDAFAVSVCKGLSVQQLRFRHACIAGAYFGGFQALMPLIGFLLGVQFQRYIVSIDHWIAFILLCLIGVNMVIESFKDAEELNASFSVMTMLPLAVATSIDALAVGVTFAFLQVNIIPAVLFIGCTTFVLSAIGIKVGNLFGARYKGRAELVGGIVLILIGCNILLEHLGYLK